MRNKATADYKEISTYVLLTMAPHMAREVRKDWGPHRMGRAQHNTAAEKYSIK